MLNPIDEPISESELIKINYLSMKKLVLLRHGQSQWNKEKRFTGWADIDLTEKGKKEAKYAGQLIKKLNYAPYFLTVNDIVSFAKSKDILCQGRGSAANSIVCYALGITSVSPEIGTMVFERFISEARNEPPDIDVDFEHERREEIIQYIYKKFGRYKAGICATVIHYKKRQALREVSKVMGLSKDLSNTIITQYNLGNIEYTKGSYQQKLSTKTASPQINKILKDQSQIPQEVLAKRR